VRGGGGGGAGEWASEMSQKKLDDRGLEELGPSAGDSLL
jgi:hypothetical protein